MKTYPTISGLTPKLREALKGEPIYLFRKDDGSNLRAEWNKKNGFYKFGRRNGLLDDSNPVLLEGPELFLNKYGEHFSKKFTDKGNVESATVYFEFFGPNSSFGNHVKEQHEVQAFDISIYKRGFLAPAMFLRYMEGFDSGLVMASVFTERFEQTLDLVRDGTLPGISFEGVVGKGEAGVAMGEAFKYKCQRWYDALKAHCGDNRDLYNLLK